VAWLRSGLFELGDCQFDYAHATTSDVFRGLRASFDALRPGLPINNVAEVTAICMLAKQVIDFSEAKSRRIPCFFASSPIYRKGLALAGLENVLKYNFRGRTMTVLRDEGYYKLRATLHPPGALRSSPQFRVFANSFDELCGRVGEFRVRSSGCRQVCAADQSALFHNEHTHAVVFDYDCRISQSAASGQSIGFICSRK
jgi:hypothetical protein